MKIRIIVIFHSGPDESVFRRIGIPVLNRIKLINALVGEATREQIELLSDDPRVKKISYSHAVVRP